MNKALITWCSPQLKKEFAALAKKERRTESQLLRIIVEDRIKESKLKSHA